jgi:hypothetical protein
MRVRTALASAGVASLAFVGMTAQTAHAASWNFTGDGFSTKSGCVDAGQQYEREGYPYKCEAGVLPPSNQLIWWLYIYE